MNSTSISVGLRPWTKGDLELLRQLLGDPAMMTHLGGPESDEKIAKRLLRYIPSSPASRMFVITIGDDEEPAGSVGYWEKWHDGQAAYETGWSVLPAFQGQGIASRGTHQALRRAADEGRHPYVHAFPSVENGPSNAICQKLGFELLGPIDFEYPPGKMMRCNDWRFDLGRLSP